MYIVSTTLSFPTLIYYGIQSVFLEVIVNRSSFMAYHRGCNKSNTTGATCGAGAPEFTPVLVVYVLFNLQFSVQCFVDHCLSFCPFSVWPIYCLSFFDIKLLVTPVVSHCMSYFDIRPLATPVVSHCMSFFDIRLLVTPVVSHGLSFFDIRLMVTPVLSSNFSLDIFRFLLVSSGLVGIWKS